jgi:glycosyltransferase involved in cell wall biosynthesis
MRVAALIQVRNEEQYLPAWLDNVSDCVDGIIALDDGSTDATRDILRSHPKLVELLENEPNRPWNERANQIALVEASRRHSAEWVLCLDADERLELRFTESLGVALDDADANDKKAFLFSVRELWDDPEQYRVDGVWSMKNICRLFKNDPAHRRFDPRPLHRFWPPLEIVAQLGTCALQRGDRIYHLRMIRAADRTARVEQYEALDPDRRFQRIGYRYLIDESGIEFERVSHERRYVPVHRDHVGK